MTASTTRWAGDPVVPADYEDLHGLVRLARRARDVPVEIDWVFAEADIRRLRDAVYAWSGDVVGRFKCFDSRVLRAVAQALQETDSRFHVDEPRGTESVPIQVSCTASGGDFHLRGHAPFGVVFGYGDAGASEDSESRARLGEDVRRTLLEMVGSLGWDVRRLNSPRFLPVRNVLFGLPPAYAAEETNGPGQVPLEVRVAFEGPFVAHGDATEPCLFSSPLGERRGVYLWTVLVEGRERAWYVGQTQRSFSERTAEHLAGYLSGGYAIPDPAALAAGKPKEIWPGCAGSTGIPLFLREYPRLAPRILETIRLLRFHCAPLEGGARLQERVEGAVGRHLKAHGDDGVRACFDSGIRLPARIPGERPLRLLLSSRTKIDGLPEDLLA